MTPYLKTFFKEKQLPSVTWDLVDNEGVAHIISSDVVLEAMEQAPVSELHAIENVIRKIDFNDGDVNDFLKHLAGALING